VLRGNNQRLKYTMSYQSIEKKRQISIEIGKIQNIRHLRTEVLEFRLMGFKLVKLGLRLWEAQE
jgi:hypothetical protein